MNGKETWMKGLDLPFLVADDDRKTNPGDFPEAFSESE
jgi:hypothetical protein